MTNIIMARIDEHLIHGSITEEWCDALESELIIIVNDQVAEDKLRQGILDMAVPEEVFARYYSIEKAIKKLPQLDETKHPLVIFASIQDAIQVIDQGAEITHLNLGCLKHTKGRHQYGYDVYLNKEEVEMLRNLMEKGIKIDLRSSPEEEAEPLAISLKKP